MTQQVSVFQIATMVVASGSLGQSWPPAGLGHQSKYRRLPSAAWTPSTTSLGSSEAAFVGGRCDSPATMPYDFPLQRDDGDEKDVPKAYITLVILPDESDFSVG